MLYMQVILYRSLPVSYFSYCRMLKQYIVLFPASLPHRIFLDCISLFIRYDMITNYTLKGAYRFLRQPQKRALSAITQQAIFYSFVAVRLYTFYRKLCASKAASPLPVLLLPK